MRIVAIIMGLSLSLLRGDDAFRITSPKESAVILQQPVCVSFLRPEFLRGKPLEIRICDAVGGKTYFEEVVTGNQCWATRLPEGVPLALHILGEYAKDIPSDMTRRPFMVKSVDSGMIYPTDGCLSVSVPAHFRWHENTRAEWYSLKIGSESGANDIFDSGKIRDCSVEIRGIPEGRPLFGRISAGASGWKTEHDFQFMSNPDVNAGRIILRFPEDGAVSIDSSRPFSWDEIPGSEYYQVRIGNPDDAASVLFDSGKIGVPFVFPRALPRQRLLKGELTVGFDGQAFRKTFHFSVGDPMDGERYAALAAIQATSMIRAWSGVRGRPLKWTLLNGISAGNQRDESTCYDYSITALQVFAQAGIPGKIRLLNVVLAKKRDSHTLVEWCAPGSDAWTILDPTFGMYVTSSDGGPLDADAMRGVLAEGRWDRIKFHYVTRFEDYFTKGYYIDYPLLFSQIADRDFVFYNPSPKFPRQYLEAVDTGVDTARGTFYIVADRDIAVSILVRRGDDILVESVQVWDGMSRAIQADEIQLEDRSQASLFRLRRFLFK